MSSLEQYFKTGYDEHYSEVAKYIRRRAILASSAIVSFGAAIVIERLDTDKVISGYSDPILALTAFVGVASAFYLNVTIHEEKAKVNEFAVNEINQAASEGVNPAAWAVGSVETMGEENNHDDNESYR